MHQHPGCPKICKIRHAHPEDESDQCVPSICQYTVKIKKCGVLIRSLNRVIIGGWAHPDTSSEVHLGKTGPCWVAHRCKLGIRVHITSFNRLSANSNYISNVRGLKPQKSSCTIWLDECWRRGHDAECHRLWATHHREAQRRECAC